MNEQFEDTLMAEAVASANRNTIERYEAALARAEAER